MASRTRQPEEVRIPLPTDEDWLLVKAALTWGEARDAEVRLFKATAPGAFQVDPAQVGATLVCAYLLDWSLTDAEGKPIHVRRQGDTAILAALRGLDARKGDEVIAAVTAHDTAQRAAAVTEKNAPGGGTPS